MKNHTYAILAAAGLTFGCAPVGGTVGTTTASELDKVVPVTLYEFVEHGPSAEASQPNANDLACARACISGYAAAQKACDGQDSAACRMDVAAQAGSCVESSCYEVPNTVGAPSCALDCAKEAAIASRGCTGAGCEAEANDVYAVCYDATCRDGFLARRVTDRLASAIERPEEAEPVAAEEGPAFDCQAACAAYEISLYLRCVDEHPADPTPCRGARDCS